jgi:hypothetical protein
MLLEHKVHFRAKMIISLTFDVFRCEKQRSEHLEVNLNFINYSHVWFQVPSQIRQRVRNDNELAIEHKVNEVSLAKKTKY